MKNIKELIKNKPIIYLSAVVGLMLILGISFAYFGLVVTGNEEAKQMTVTAGNLSLYYNSGPEIKMDNIEPGVSIIKEFTVTNTGTFDTDFDINMTDMINTIEKDELVYTLECISYEKYGQKDQTELGSCDGQTSTIFDYSETATSQKLKGSNSINVGVTNKYTLTITFKEMGSAQNYNQGKKFIGKIQINEYNYNDSSIPVINDASINDLLLTAVIKDSNGLSAYSITSADATEAGTWKSTSGSESTISETVDDYDKKIWVKNASGTIVYKDLTPVSNLTIDPAGGTYEGSTGIITTSERYKTEIELSDPTKEGYDFEGWDVTGEKSTLKDSSTAMVVNKVRMMSTKLAEGNSTNKTLVMGIKETKVTATWDSKEYNLTINPNNGTYNGSTTSQNIKVKYNKAQTIENPTREGYTFTGWTLSSTKASLNGTSFSIGAEDCTLTANWVVNSYPWIAYHNKMNVDGNGYTLVSADTKEGEADYGTKVTPSVNTYTGFTSPSAQTITITVDTKPTTKNVVNYNYERNKYKLFIDPNGGTYDDNYNATVTNEYYESKVDILTPVKTGYTFTDWSITGDSSLVDTNLTMGSENTTLTANYNANTYTVTFNANGGEIIGCDTNNYYYDYYCDSYYSAIKEVTYDDNYGALPMPAMVGYEFLGWYTDPWDGYLITDGDYVDITSNQTFYAHWEELQPLTDYLLSNYDGISITHIEQEETELQPYVTHEYRFQGEYPNNYIYFNRELWRIIGVFEVDTPNVDGTYTREYKVKIVGESIGTLALNKSSSNNWVKSTLSSTLNDYWRLGYYNKNNNTSNVLYDEWRYLISPTVWYLGNVTYGSSSKDALGTYQEERSWNVHSGNYPTWEGYVGLIYPSDYMYASSDCYNDGTIGMAYSDSTCDNSNWLSRMFGTLSWTISPESANSYYNIVVARTSGVKYYDVKYANSVHPTVYLNSKVGYLGGEGTENNPFFIK